MIISSSITRSPEINEIDASGSAVSDRSDHELFIRGNKYMLFLFCNFPGVNCWIIVNLFNSLTPNFLSFKYLLSLISDSVDSN